MTCGISETPSRTSCTRPKRLMRVASSGSGPQKLVWLTQYASAVILSARPKASKVSTVLQFTPSARPTSSGPSALSTTRVMMSGNSDS